MPKPHWQHQFACRCAQFSPAFVNNRCCFHRRLRRTGRRGVPRWRHRAALACAGLAASWRRVCGWRRWLAHERWIRHACLRSRPRTGQCSGWYGVAAGLPGDVPAPRRLGNALEQLLRLASPRCPPRGAHGRHRRRCALPVPLVSLAPNTPSRGLCRSLPLLSVGWLCHPCRLSVAALPSRPEFPPTGGVFPLPSAGLLGLPLAHCGLSSLLARLRNIRRGALWRQGQCPPLRSGWRRLGLACGRTSDAEAGGPGGGRGAGRWRAGHRPGCHSRHVRGALPSPAGRPPRGGCQRGQEGGPGGPRGWRPAVAGPARLQARDAPAQGLFGLVENGQIVLLPQFRLYRSGPGGQSLCSPWESGSSAPASSTACRR